MKKTIKQLLCLCLLLTVLSINTFAGDYPNGGKSCPTSSPCLVSEIENSDVSIENSLQKLLKSFVIIFQ